MGACYDDLPSIIGLPVSDNQRAMLPGPSWRVLLTQPLQNRNPRRLPRNPLTAAAAAQCPAQCLRPEHRDGGYQRGRYGSEIRGVEDEPDARPQVAAQGNNPAEHAKAERDYQNRYRGLYHLTGTVRQTARERYEDHRQDWQREDATGDKLR